MANIFSNTNNFVDKPKRNVFDLSFQNNLTMQFGKLYPVFCKEVIPGDSFQITPTFGLKFMPMVFPVQTRMQANLHFYYVRNRNLWKDWPDFIGKTKDNLVAPYIELSRKDTKTGSLADYLGIPTTCAGKFGSTFAGRFPASFTGLNANYVTDIKIADTTDETIAALVGKSFNTHLSTASNSDSTLYYASPLTLPLVGLQLLPSSADVYATITYNQSNASGSLVSPQAQNDFLVFTKINNEQTVVSAVRCTVTVDGKLTKLSFDAAAVEDAFEFAGYSASDGYNIYYVSSSISRSNTKVFTDATTLSTAYRGSLNCDFTFPISFEGVHDISEYGVTNPFADKKIAVSALPFRAYESIYNSFYRNQQNDPFKINGVAEYNKYITNSEGGKDNTLYSLMTKNWEKDFLTSSMPSPQQGVAPLVGVNAAGTFTFRDSEGKEYTAQCTVGDDGETLTGISMHSPDMPAGSLRALVDTISSGISINDFRNVNALQRWLEANMRRGFRYKDQLLTHFGVDAEYNVLDMPEFIGGCSEPILVNQISQTVDSADAPLGSYAGQASCIGTSKHSINKYCDEHGFIIGIMSVAPVPNYSQLLPKHFLKSEPLDYFFPEFGHIGMQPINYKEVCPVQAYGSDLANGTDTLNDTFGYQRAWYDYLASVDEVHGEFRTSLRDFLINRVFDTKPVLGHEFLKIDPRTVNEVFSVTDTSDKILGQMYFQVTAKRPIPRLGIPRLE